MWDRVADSVCRAKRDKAARYRVPTLSIVQVFNVRKSHPSHLRLFLAQALDDICLFARSTACHEPSPKHRIRQL